jgi:CDP-diacylglycerol--glycerol-3-phosphate 3-phosphatidyltransferase
MNKLTFKHFNLADWFSFYRIATAPVLLAILFANQRILFTALLLISYTTDMVDGYLARYYNMASKRGSQLDSMGDQLTFIVGLIGLYYYETTFILENMIFIAGLFILYGIQMLIAFIKYGKATAFHTYAAKSSAVLQAAFILWALFYDPVYWLFYIVVIVGVIETIEEITLIFMHQHWMSDVKGVYWTLMDRKNKSQEV